MPRDPSPAYLTVHANAAGGVGRGQVSRGEPSMQAWSQGHQMGSKVVRMWASWAALRASTRCWMQRVDAYGRKWLRNRGAVGARAGEGRACTCGLALSAARHDGCCVGNGAAFRDTLLLTAPGLDIAPGARGLTLPLRAFGRAFLQAKVQPSSGQPPCSRLRFAGAQLGRLALVAPSVGCWLASARACVFCTCALSADLCAVGAVVAATRQLSAPGGVGEGICGGGGARRCS